MKKVSHVKLIVLFTLVGIPLVADADDYLMTLTVAGEYAGEYLISRSDDGTATAEAALWQAVGVNASDALPLERLNGMGRTRIVWSEQTIFFYPHRDTTARKMAKIEAVIEAQVDAVSVKSADYYLTHHSEAENSVIGSATATGRLSSFDLDLRAGIGGSESYFSSQWHDENNRFITDIEIGRVQRYGLDGIGLTNEKSLATSAFGADQIELYWPHGTRVDVYRDGAYIESLTLTSDPHSYEIELDYSSNRYEFKAILPDGRTDTRTVERSVSGRLAPLGKVNYGFAAGKTGARNLATGYLAYGLTNELSLIAGQDRHEKGYMSALYSHNNLAFEPILYNGSEYALNANWSGNKYSMFGRVSDLNGFEQKSVSLSYQSLIRPSFQYSSREYKGVITEEKTLRTYHNVYLSPLSTSLSLSPHISIRDRNDVESKAFGARMLSNLPAGWQSVLTFEREVHDHTGIELIQRFQGEISKRFKLGRLTYRHSSIDFGNGWNTQQQSLRADLWNWDRASLSAAVNRSAAGQKSFLISISGSLGRNGFRRSPQRSQATMELSTCIDQDGDGICQDDEPEVTGIAARIGERTITTPSIVESLTPYRSYDVEMYSGFGLTPRYSAVKSGSLVRGGVNRLRLPLSEMREIEGQLESDGIRVALIDQDTGEVLAEQRTEFEGWYLFYAPSHRTVEVRILEFDDEIEISSDVGIAQVD